MTQMFVFTAGNSEARGHLRDSIEQPIAKDVLSYASTDGERAALEAVRQTVGAFYAWGAEPGPKNIPNWTRMQPGDVVLCVFDSTYRYVAEVVRTLHNKPLAEAIWGTNANNGNTWEYIYLLTRPRPANARVEALSRWLPNGYMGFTRIHDERLRRIEGEFGSVRRFVESHLPVSSVEVGEDAVSRREADRFLQVMRRYHAKRTVFQSARRGALYTVESVDPDGCTIRRLNANDPARCTVSQFASCMQRIRSAGGRMRFDDSFVSTVAIRTGYLQSPDLVLSADGSSVIEAINRTRASELFAQYIDDLDVDRSGPSPKLYKPGLLSCVLDGVDAGELRENWIEFEWLVPRFVRKMASVGVEVTDRQAAYAFVSLKNDLVWMLSHSDVRTALEIADNPTPARIRAGVTGAMLKETFWDAIQDREIRQGLLRHIAQQWWPEVNTMTIDRGLLAKAVEEVIRPRLIDQGGLEDRAIEGYQHQQVLPAAQASLARAQIEADPVAALSQAIRASRNLLSHHESSPALAFLAESEPSAVRDAAIGLLYGTEDAEGRIRRFLGWGSLHKNAVGEKRGFNETVIGYLLAMSDPSRYAFCKPSVYSPAAAALLGKDEVETDAARRLLHATRFYEEALRIFVEEHHLPFTDLLHVHIAFYLMRKLWAGLQNTASGQENGPETIVRDDDVGRLLLAELNVVLYGPPGTGKTRKSLWLADRWRDWQGAETVRQVTFHPSYAYEDFIEGFRPTPNGGGFQIRDGIFVDFLGEAHRNRSRNFLLVIDEINRGDVARIFGELITLLENDKRREGASRRLPYSQKTIWIPPNLHLLGTMNTADRSISLMDIAIRRRFCFVEFLPEPDAIEESEEHLQSIGDVSLASLLEGLNKRLSRVIDRDRAIGHSYFLIPRNDREPLRTLRDRLQYAVAPLIEEYCYAERRLAQQILGDLVDAQGALDRDVLLDEGRFVQALRQLAESL